MSKVLLISELVSDLNHWSILWSFSSSSYYNTSERL